MHAWLALLLVLCVVGVSALLVQVRRLRLQLAALGHSAARRDVAAVDAAAPKQGLEMTAFYPVEPLPRYGHGHPYLPRMMAALDAGQPRYRALLNDFLPLLPDLRAIAPHPQAAQPAAPAWINGFLPGLDTVALFGILSTQRPARYLEIGSGNSTKIAAYAKRLHSPATRIISIDPQPRAEIDALCDDVVRHPLERADLDVFGTLTAGDVVFFDGSHRVFQNSDVTVFFLEVLPRLPAGVWIQIHDIFWPDDYPAAWADRYYSEQYLAALLTLFGEQHFEIALPNAYIATCTELGALFAELWNAPELAGIEAHGSSLWLRSR